MNFQSSLTIGLFLALICCAYSQSTTDSFIKSVTVQELTAFNKWQIQFGLKFENENENLYRKTVFIENLRKIKEHNDNQEKTYTKGVNQFTGMTQEEFVSKILTKINPQPRLLEEDEENAHRISSRKIQSHAPSINWKLAGAVSSIKNQGSCGACWAFTMAALMESNNYLLRGGPLLDLSEQQLIDCVNPTLWSGYTSLGCQGGAPAECLHYAARYGIKSEQNYPFTGVQGSCQVTTPLPPQNAYYLQAYYQTFSTVTSFKNELQQHPISVIIDASNWGSYSSGVFTGCSSTVTINHGVNVIGYDINGNWILKNSWGTSWGDQGFMTIQSGNSCGILTNGYYILY